MTQSGKKSSSKISKINRNHVAQMIHYGGKSMAEMATEYKISKVTLFEWCRKHNIDTRHTARTSKWYVARMGKPELTPDRLLKLVNRLGGLRPVAQSLNVDYTALGDYAKRVGIVRKPGTYVYTLEKGQKKPNS